MKGCVWACLLLLTLAASVSAKTYYVAMDGNDENPGNKAKPFRTIQKAADTARAGDTIIVRGGIYHENVIMRCSGRPGGPITLKNYPDEKPIIQPGRRDEQPPGHGVLLQAQEGYQKPIGWIIIEGLEIRYGHDGIKIYNAHDIVIHNCNIHENYNQGILGNGNRVLIDRNIIAGNGTNKDTAQNLIHGIYATGTAFKITNNLIHSNTAYGIQVVAYDYKEDSMAGPEYAEAKNWLVANNTIALNKNRAGIVIWQDGVENCIVQNNIFYRNGGVNGILFYSQQNQHHPVRNNIFYPPGENLVSSEEGAFRAIGNQQINPCFVDADSFDFHLKAGSPAIDAGFADRAPNMDFEGKPRPQDSKVDIGAYEATPIAQNKGPVVKAFLTAEGFGANARGGRGGRVIEVTNLNDSGAGSLRDALEVATGPRIVVFRVSGTIELESDIRIRGESGSFVTVAGQTSPGGVQLKGDGLVVMDGAHDVVVRYLRIRPGAHLPVLRDTNGFIAWGNDGKPVYNIIVDHCSLQWSTDQNGPDAWHWVTNYTSQWNIIAEGTTEGHAKGSHGMGILVGGRTAEEKLTMSIHHCLFAHNGGRNPLIASADVVDFRNNIVYNWGGNNAAAWGCFANNQSVFGNIVNNHYIAGPNSSTANIYWLENGGPTRIDGTSADRGGTKVFMQGNLGPNRFSRDTDDWTNGVFQLDYWTRDRSSHFPVASQAQFRARTPFIAPPVTTTPIQDLKPAVLPTVGASRPSRDALDARIVQDVMDVTGNIDRISAGGPWPVLTGGPPPKDSDHDGMPDEWERAKGLDPEYPDDSKGDMNNDGYTNIEDYLNELAGDTTPAHSAKT